MKKILIIEDDEQDIKILKSILKKAGFSVEVAKDGGDGSFLASTKDYDLIFLDYNLPKKNGKQVCEDIRALGKKTPIIMITVRSAIVEKTEMLYLGVDDYLVKPYNGDELLAKVHAMLRRAPQEIQSPVIKFDNLTINYEGHEVIYHGQPINLSVQQFFILEYFARHKNECLSAALLAQKIYNTDSPAKQQTVQSHISNLRKKFRKVKPDADIIQVIKGRGYRLVA